MKSHLHEFTLAQEFESFDGLVRRTRTNIWAQGNRRALAELGITLTQGVIILALAAGTETTSTQLARRLGLNGSSITRLIAQMETQRFILKKRVSYDRRVGNLTLTLDGQIAAKRLTIIIEDVLTQSLVNFLPEEISLLKKILKRIITNSESSKKPLPSGSCRSFSDFDRI